MISRIIQLGLRAVVPLAILVGGIYGFRKLSVEPEEAKKPPAAKQVIRTRAEPLEVGTYTVVVRTHGIVSAHDLVTLSAEVSGRITTIHPRFEVGSFFSKGDILLELDSRDYESALSVARARKKLAESALLLASTSHGRMSQLTQVNGASKLELDQAAADLAKAEAELDVANSDLDQAERDLSRTKIAAPFDGRVAARVVGLGQLISPGAALGQIFAVDYAEVRLPLANADREFLELPEMENDPPVDVELRDAINPQSDRSWKAQIVRTEGSLDEDSLDLFAIARVEDPFALQSGSAVLRIGQPVVATITGMELDGVIKIPRGAVRQLDKVFLIDNDALTLRSLTIEPVWSDEQYVIVQTPEIGEHDLLATTQIVYAPEGSSVEIIPDTDTDEADKLVAKQVDEE